MMMSPVWRIGRPLPRALIAAAILAAVIIGGLLIGATRGLTDTGPDW